MWLTCPFPVGGNLPFLLTPGEYTLGSSRYCDVIIYDSSISKRHARLLAIGGSLRVIDLGSRHGLHRSGQAVKDVLLSIDDRFAIGAVPCLLAGTPVSPRQIDDECIGCVSADAKTTNLELKSLTPTEQLVAKLSVDGLTETQMAQHLGVTAGTLHCHLKSIYKKLGVHSRTQLVIMLLSSPAEKNSATYPV
jgi:DNA-binding CsgD family transcriptional regulator